MRAQAGRSLPPGAARLSRRVGFPSLEPVVFGSVQPLRTQAEPDMDEHPRGNRAVFKVRAGKAAMTGKVEVSTPP